MKRLSLLFSAVLATVAISSFAAGGEDAVRKVFTDKLKSRADQVTRTPLPGIYEVLSEGQSIYIDEKGGYAIVGSLIDLKSMRNLSNESRAAWVQKQFASLPLDQAVKIVRGNGKRIMVTFEDPNCGYCKKLAHELTQVKDVTIYTFLYPILSEDSATKSRAIWCASDRAKAWTDWMVNGVAPVAQGGKCDADATLQRNTDLGRRLGIQGTPFIMFANGESTPGYMPAPELDKRLGKPGV
ncbi:MAG: DsbC family protein [Proteobacteria bacterium]|nr:DsbC family protein [Pseudomonadota bacterium]HQR04086.1 DsbC family protein [Rhodocyclaceae bacterium]